MSKVAPLRAGLFHDVAGRPDRGDEQHGFGYAVNLVGTLKPTEDDKIVRQFVMGIQQI